MPVESLSASASRERIRRRRVTTACVTCRDRRVKCDRSRPACVQCKKGERKCKYVEKKVPNIEFVEEPGNPVTGPGGGGPSSLDTWKSVIEHQADLVKRSDDAKIGVPFWAVAEAEEPSRVQTTRLHKCGPRQYVISIEALGENYVAAVMNHLPSRETCLGFFEGFLLGIHPIISVCHITTLRREYDDFWANISPSYSVESLALMLAVLYTGAANSAPPDIENSSILLRLYETIFSMVNFESYLTRNTAASIHLLQGYVIMNTFQASYLAPFSAFGFLPQVIRFAQSLRLHVDKTTRDPIELEIRRRIWWHLLFLDVESTVATGLPPIIHRAGYTTQLPSMLHDDVVSAIADSLPGPNQFSLMMIAMQGQYQWACRMQAWFESLPTLDEVYHFKTLIESLLELIPAIQIPETEWARTYLRMLIDRAYCMLGLRFWQLDPYKGTACHSEVVKTARSFLTRYLHLSTLPFSAQFIWFVPGLIQPLHALVILLVHLSSCHNIAEEEPLSRSLLDTVLSLRVNRIMNGSIVPRKTLIRSDDTSQRTNPRYLILVELRRRVWRKLGWDRDGREVDPWSGRVGAEEVVGGGPDEGEIGMGSAFVGKDLLGNWDGGRAGEESTRLEGIDSMLTDDPFDMFKWDEWESFASGLFAS